MRPETTPPTRSSRRLLIIASLTAVLFFGLPTTAYQQTLAGAPIDIHIPIDPTPVHAGGKVALVYELHITNFSSREFTLTGIDVTGDSTGATPLVSYSGDALTAVLNRPGVPRPPAPADGPPPAVDKRPIGGGLTAIARMWVTVEPGRVPAQLLHRLTFDYLDTAGAKQSLAVDAFDVTVAHAIPMVFSSPFEGGMWIAGNGPSNSSGHRTTIIPLNGRARIAQRFAIDWVKFGDSGLPYHDDKTKNENWYGYGQPLHAVADGTVVEVKDGIMENTPLSPTMAVPITYETIAGNHVVLDLGGGRFVLYAHMKPQSPRVRVGDRVKRGQVLGLLGNSGNSDAPHLHLHVTDGSSPLGAEGIPYVFERFDEIGVVTSIDELLEQGKPWKPAPAPIVTRTKEIPLENVMVRFPAK